MKTFNYEKALSVCGDDVELLRELIDLFKQQSPQLMADIQKAIKATQPDKLARAAHTLKGSLANLGGTAACEIAHKLETMGLDNNITGAETLFQNLTREVEKFEHEAANLERTSV